MTTGRYRLTGGNILWPSAQSASHEEFIIGNSRLINTVQIQIPLLALRASMSVEIKCSVSFALVSLHAFSSRWKRESRSMLWHHKSQHFVTGHTDNFKLKFHHFSPLENQVKTIRDLQCTLTDNAHGFNTIPFTSVVLKEGYQPAAPLAFYWI